MSVQTKKVFALYRVLENAAGVLLVLVYRFSSFFAAGVERNPEQLFSLVLDRSGVLVK